MPESVQIEINDKPASRAQLAAASATAFAGVRNRGPITAPHDIYAYPAGDGTRYQVAMHPLMPGWCVVHEEPIERDGMPYWSGVIVDGIKESFSLKNAIGTMIRLARGESA